MHNSEDEQQATVWASVSFSILIIIISVIISYHLKFYHQQQLHSSFFFFFSYFSRCSAALTAIRTTFLQTSLFSAFRLTSVEYSLASIYWVFILAEKSRCKLHISFYSRFWPVTTFNGVGYNIKTRTERRNWTELNWHGLVFDEVTTGQARRARWILVDAYVSVVTSMGHRRRY